MALLLCYATAIAYAELSKLYPGAGSSYFFAEQAFLSKTHAYRFATNLEVHHRLGQPPLLLALPRRDGGRDRHSGRDTSPVSSFPIRSMAASTAPLMIGFCILFAFGVAYIAYTRGRQGRRA